MYHFTVITFMYGGWYSFWTFPSRALGTESHYCLTSTVTSEYLTMLFRWPHRKSENLVNDIMSHATSNKASLAQMVWNQVRSPTWISFGTWTEKVHILVPIELAVTLLRSCIAVSICTPVRSIFYLPYRFLVCTDKRQTSLEFYGW